MAQRRVEDKLELLRKHYEGGVPWGRMAAKARVPRRALSRWAAAYRADPTHSGLTRRQRVDRGSKKIPAESVEAIEALALRRPAPTMAFISRVGDIARDRGLPVPSYSSVRAVVTAIDPGLITLVQEGDAAYRDRFELVFRHAASRPNEQWQADHTHLDIMGVDKGGSPVRPWLTSVLDDYSRAIAGYTLFAGAPTAEQTALALHQAVNRKASPLWSVCGLPEVLYSDHVADFTFHRLEWVCLDTPGVLT